jgi:ribosomal RNA-processing protein 17
LEAHVQSIHAIFKEMNSRTKTGSNNGEEEENNDADEESNSSNSEWQGFADNPPALLKDQEYIDEDQYATVTVEAVDINRDGFVTRKEGDEAEKSVEVENAEKLAGEGKKRVWTKEKPKKSVMKKKAKPKKFRYENKTERKVTRAKERSKNSSQAKARREKDS